MNGSTKIFLHVARVVIALALLLDGVIMSKVLRIETSRRSDSVQAEAMAENYKRFLAPEYAPTEKRLDAENKFIEQELASLTRLETTGNEKLSARAKSNLSMMRKTARTLEDSLAQMETHAQVQARQATAQHKLDRWGDTGIWDAAVDYSIICVGSFVAPLTLIVLLFVAVDAPIKIRFIARYRLDAVFLSSVIFKLIYCGLFLWQWERLLDVCYTQTACIFVGVLAPLFSILLSSTVYTVERRVSEKNFDIKNQNRKDDSENIVIENIDLDREKSDLTFDKIVQKGQNGHTQTPKSVLPHPYLTPGGKNGHTNGNVRSIRQTVFEFDSSENGQSVIESNKNSVMTINAMPEMWNGLDSARQAWHDTLLLTGTREALAQGRKLDVWRDVPPPVDVAMCKAFLRLLVLNNQFKRGDVKFVGEFIGVFKRTPFRRALEDAQITFRRFNRSQVKERFLHEVKEYLNQ